MKAFSKPKLLIFASVVLIATWLSSVSSLAQNYAWRSYPESSSEILMAQRSPNRDSRRNLASQSHAGKKYKMSELSALRAKKRQERKTVHMAYPLQPRVKTKRSHLKSLEGDLDNHPTTDEAHLAASNAPAKK